MLQVPVAPAVSSVRPQRKTRRWRAKTAAWLRRHGEAIVYRGAGLAMRLPRSPPEGTDRWLRVIRQAYLSEFWSPRSRSDWFDLITAIVLWPIAVPIAAAWLALRNGKVTQRRCGKGRLRQWWEQMVHAARRGILPSWYYVFELYRPDRAAHAAEFIGRAESKEGAYRILTDRRHPTSSLSDKLAFAERCDRFRLPHPATLAVARGGELMPGSVSPASLPTLDLFIKPVRASGGRGAQRCDHIGKRVLRGS